MRPIAAVGVAWSMCRSVCWSLTTVAPTNRVVVLGTCTGTWMTEYWLQLCLQTRLNRLRCRLGRGLVKYKEPCIRRWPGFHHEKMHPWCEHIGRYLDIPGGRYTQRDSQLRRQLVVTVRTYCDNLLYFFLHYYSVTVWFSEMQASRILSTRYSFGEPLERLKLCVTRPMTIYVCKRYRIKCVHKMKTKYFCPAAVDLTVNFDLWSFLRANSLKPHKMAELSKFFIQFASKASSARATSAAESVMPEGCSIAVWSHHLAGATERNQNNVLSYRHADTLTSHPT